MLLPTSPTFLSRSILPLISLSLAPVSLAAAKDYQVQTPPLTTNWTYTAGTDPWTEYPRPQLVRPAWQSLNGVWAWRNATGGLDELGDPPTGQTFDDPVLVPSCLESGLSGECGCGCGCGCGCIRTLLDTVNWRAVGCFFGS